MEQTHVRCYQSVLPILKVGRVTPCAPFPANLVFSSFLGRQRTASPTGPYSSGGRMLKLSVTACACIPAWFVTVLMRTTVRVANSAVT
jgi:hypothetical protein